MLIGGSSLVNIAIGIIRTKVMAVLLGPSGVGLAGLYGSIADVAVSISGMGISSSGVRQIAEAAGSGDTERIARTAAVLRRTSIILGLLGAGSLIVFSDTVSKWTFGTDLHRSAVVLLACVVLFRVITDGQTALIQGMRRISDLAGISILGALVGTVSALSLVYFLGDRGVAPALLAVAAGTLLVSWWYRRKIPIPMHTLSASQVGAEIAALLKLGLAFMASSLMMMGSTYAIRTLVLRWLGFEASGLYQSAWTLGGLYTGFILQAMGADFYPRLTAIADDNAACNRLVNEQARIGLLLAAPGVIATITVAPLVLVLFYSSAFEGAVSILRWICLGMTLRVISWPMGFIVLAKGRRSVFFWSDVAWTVVHVGLASVCLLWFGVVGAGLAFCGSYLFHAVLIYFLVNRMTGFLWSYNNKRNALVFLPLIVMSLCVPYLSPPHWVATVGIVATVASGAYSGREIVRIMPLDTIPRPIVRIALALKFV